MSAAPRIRVYLVDDEPLALRRLRRLLEEAGRVEVAGSASDPEEAVEFLRAHRVDGLFLDIQMPGMTGFDLLARFDRHPPIVFTTAYDQYALRAFEVYSVDYLLKPVEAPQLERAISKLERAASAGAAADLGGLLERLAASVRGGAPEYPERVASRLGDRVQFVDLSDVTHFFASDKLTYAATGSRDYVVDQTIAELERQLDPKLFARVHRSVLLNVEFVDEVRTGFGGRLVVRLRDTKRTEIGVSRDRAREFRARLGF